MTEEELTGDWREIYVRAYEHAVAEREALQQATKQIKAITVTIAGGGAGAPVTGGSGGAASVTTDDQRNSSWYGLPNGEAMIILAARAAELHKKAVQANIFDSERVKYGFAAREIEKLVEELKAL